MRSKISPFTWAGLFISLFGFIALRLTFRAFGVSNSITADVWREFAVWIMAAVLIVMVRFGERLPLKSIGLGTAPRRESIRFGCILTGLCGVTAWIVILFTGYGHGPGSAEFNKEPIWFETLAVIRSGIVEELFSAVTRLNGWSQLAVAAYSPGQFRWRFFRQHIGPGESRTSSSPWWLARC
jgi:hypothetical protein